MTFSEFAITLYPFCRNGKKAHDFVVSLTDNFMTDDATNPLLNYGDSNLGKIFKGERNINSDDASIILKNSDKVKFAQYISDISDDARQALCDALANKSVMATIHDVSDKCGDMMLEIITIIASGAKAATLMEVAEEFALESKLITPSPNSSVNAYLLSETKATCPLCNKPLMRKNDGKPVVGYTITSIYPLAPTGAQLKELFEISTPSDLSANENKIALCHSCSINYLTHFSQSEYLNLLNIKARLAQDFHAAAIIDSVVLEDDIRKIVMQIATANIGDLSEALSYSALRISEKITTDNTPLILKAEGFVCNYYNYIKILFGEAEQENRIDFDIIAREIKLCSDKLIKSGLSQERVFENLVDWIKGKTAATNVTACEIVVSFFIQNCEVFNAIAK